jgi:hypothetical protein
MLPIVSQFESLHAARQLRCSSGTQALLFLPNLHRATLIIPPGGRTKMKTCLLCLTLLLLIFTAEAQEQAVSIHIKLINGRTGEPMKHEQVGLEDGASYRELSVRTNELGVASLNIRGDAVILTHNTDGYVNCADERGGLIPNDFKVSQIFSNGIVQPIIQPNLCGKTSGVAKPGELILFVRRWRLGEKI